MRINRREFIQMAGVGLPTALTLSSAVISTAHASETAPDDLPLPDETLHVLNRTSFGVHKDNIAAVAEDGLDEYLRKQIYPTIAEDPETEAYLARHYPQAYWPRKAMVEFYFGSNRKIGLPVGIPKQLERQAEEPMQMYREVRDRVGTGVGVGVGMADEVPLPKEVSDLGRLNRPGLALTALQGMTLYRALRNPNQLYELMVEFWGNHFSIDASSHKYLFVHKLLDDREVIRPNCMSDFRTLLNASARSTAMLYYLDGVSNTKGAPNENYARELMELHTLGVGNYSHHDVLNVARCFTGWTIDPNTADFTFDDSRHDKDEKTVLGRTIPAGGGIEDGQKVLDILMEEAATARLIATKLVRRFVSDDPPSSLVDRVIAAFGVDGDIKKMLEVILFSPEFREARDEKVKRPIQFMISSMRATSTDILPGRLGTLIYYLTPMAQLPYKWPTPDGYPDVANYWISANGLLHRWKFGLFIGNSGGGSKIDVDIETLMDGAETPREIVEALRANVLRRFVTVDDENHFVAYAAEDDDPDLPLTSLNDRKRRARGVLSLMLNSIYFQLS